MKFVDFVVGCEPSELFIGDVDIPTPLSNQVLVKVTAFGVNRADTLQRQGKYPPPSGESEILGLEVSGQVVELGSNVSQWKKGQSVFGLVAGGGYAQYVAVEASHLMPVPKTVSLNQAAGIAEVFLTAYQSLFELGGLKPNQKVLIHAGASGVGLAAIQLAKALGAEVAVTASSQQKLLACKALGADLSINYTAENFADAIKEKWRGVDLVIDFVGGDYLNRNLKALNIDGRIVYLAMLAGRYADKLDMAMLLGKRASIIGSTLRNRSDEYKTALINGFCKTWLASFAEGTLKANIDSLYSANDIGLAHQRLEDNQTLGKLIGLWT